MDALARARLGRSLVTCCASALLLADGCGGDSSPGPVTPRPVVIATPPNLPSGTVGVAYDLTFTATGGNGATTWSVPTGGMPDGLALSPEGRLAGTPTTPDVRRFTIRATSGLQAASSEFALAILPAPMVITNALLPDATLGVSYTQFLDVAGGDGSVNWSLASGALPAGMTLSGSGLLSGVAAALGTTTFTVRAIRGALSAERALSLAVVPAPLVIATVALPAAKVGDPFSVALESRGGSGGNAWSLAEGTLPTGLTIAAGGEISGTPTIDGTSAFTVAVVSGAQRTTRGLALTVDPAGYPLTALITTPGLVFVPLIVPIARGGTVTWRFGADPHNAIFVPTPGAPADINFVSDVDVSRTFPTPGVFRYDCTIHPGMSGVIEVKP